MPMAKYAQHSKREPNFITIDPKVRDALESLGYRAHAHGKEGWRFVPAPFVADVSKAIRVANGAPADEAEAVAAFEKRMAAPLSRDEARAARDTEKDAAHAASPLTSQPEEK